MTEESKKPFNFDWVTARQKCSLQQVFEALRVGIKEDVTARNLDFTTHPDRLRLGVTERPKIIRVFWHDTYGSTSQDRFVEFSLSPQAIVIQNEQGVQFEATVGLDDDGDCKINLGGKRYDLWQVRKRTLEHLMFDGHE